ncbi:MAG: pyruvate ferredoxin oxidoreductase [Actinobacteria bacterium]|nr:MAG: pyruvate ferredoxin oxidoreductase [Actinomycetota bacterium]
MAKIHELAEAKPRLASGHKLCPGCGASVAVNLALNSIAEPVVVSAATGCLEVSTTAFPSTSWETPFIHSAFENSAATISGIETAYRALKKQGKIKKEIKFVAFGGDGGTYDIGFQALSGAAERGHDFLYICYDNGAYMNTGIQRSSATPMGATTTTAPAGSQSIGKGEWRKDMVAIMAAHNIPYAAQASIGYWKDYVNKVEKAIAAKGPAFITVLSPCPRGWRSVEDNSIALAKEAVTCNFWPLYEVVEGNNWKINIKPSKPTSVEDWLKQQGRFKHLFTSENKETLDRIVARVDEEWQKLLKREECS